MASGLATRCTACGTVFRVVQDQLRVSEGWVRCGRCSEVFNAAENLVDTHRGAAPGADGEPPAAPPQAPPGLAYAPANPPASAPSPAPAMAPPRAPERMYDPQTDSDDDHVPRAPLDAREPANAPADHLLRDHAVAADPWQEDSGFGHTQQEDPPPWSPPAPPSPHSPPSPAAPAEHPAERFEPYIDDSIVSISAAAAGQHALPDLPDLRASPRDIEAPLDAAAAKPSFLRQAERAQRWRQPRVRVALWGLVVLAGLGLAGQVLFVYRDLAAARFTLLRPALEQACAWAGCSVGEAHAIESLVVESSGLVRVEKSSVYKLSVALRNRAAIAVAVPAVDIALTDAQGKLLARRVLLASELGSSQAALPAGRDLALQATLQAATEPVSGYTIELFYP